MPCRGTTATIEVDGDDRMFVGDVMDLADTISFTGRTVEELEAGFATAVDVYVDGCAERGVEGEAANLDGASGNRPEGPVGGASAIAPPAANGHRR